MSHFGVESKENETRNENRVEIYIETHTTGIGLDRHQIRDRGFTVTVNSQNEQDRNHMLLQNSSEFKLDLSELSIQLFIQRYIVPNDTSLK